MRRLAPLLAVLALALACSAAAGGADPQQPGAEVGVGVRHLTDVATLERQVFAAINAVRTERGLAPLRLNRRLGDAARGHSRSMAEHGFFRHVGYDGSAFWRRITPAYRPQPGRYWGAGENLVWASPGLSAAQAIDMWMKSPPHRENILTPSWRDVGVGGVHAVAAPGVYEGLEVTIVTADFGVR